MRLTQKLAYMALGGAMAVAGYLIPTAVATKATESARFDEITARVVNIEDETGQLRARVRSDDSGGVIELFDADGRLRQTISSERLPILGNILRQQGIQVPESSVVPYLKKLPPEHRQFEDKYHADVHLLEKSADR